MGRGSHFRSFRTKSAITVLREGSLEIGPRCYFNDGVNLSCSCAIRIGADTKIADWVFLYDSNFHEVAPGETVAASPIVIGRNVWIGARSMILAGSTVGDHSVVAAGSVVRGHIPDRCVVAGSPAKVIRRFDCPDGWVRL